MQITTGSPSPPFPPPTLGLFCASSDRLRSGLVNLTYRAQINYEVTGRLVPRGWKVALAKFRVAHTRDEKARRRKSEKERRRLEDEEWKKRGRRLRAKDGSRISSVSNARASGDMGHSPLFSRSRAARFSPRSRGFRAAGAPFSRIARVFLAAPRFDSRPSVCTAGARPRGEI